MFHAGAKYVCCVILQVLLGQDFFGFLAADYSTFNSLCSLGLSVSRRRRTLYTNIVAWFVGVEVNFNDKLSYFCSL